MIMHCNGLSVAYDHLVLENVSFSVEEGDFICIVGENGSGKTTLLKSILKLLPTKSGTIQMKKNIQIGYVPQKVSVKHNFPASAEEIVRSGIGTCVPFLSRKEKNLVQKNMELLGISDLRKKSFRTLSGGQQQRVLLARALCASDRFLILDEPCTGLDPLAVTDLYAFLQKINQEEKTTILMVSHDINTALGMANKILHIEKTVKFFGRPDEYVCSTCGKRFIGGESDV